jgi:mRNA interferase MazF
MKATPARGEIWWCEPPEIGRRPAVVLSRDAAIPRLGRTLVAFGTTTVRGLPSEVLLEPGDDPVSRTTAINLDSIETVSLGALVERMGRLSDWRMRQICAAIQVAVGC